LSDVHAVTAHEGYELVARHRLGTAALAHADVPEHVLEAGGRDDPQQLEIAAPGILDAVPDAPAHEDHAAAPKRHAAVLEYRRAAPRVYEDDFILVLVQVHRDRRAAPEPLPARGDKRRPRASAIDLDRHVAAPGRGTKTQRLAVPRSEHQPLWLHLNPPDRRSTTKRRRTACPRRQSIYTS
jgi:hypothetical protein